LAVVPYVVELGEPGSTIHKVVQHHALRPIVLMRRRSEANISPNVAPGTDSVGVLLLYTRSITFCSKDLSA
jgi:hydrogenase maturation factor HypF (carbamoyltransferase family)